MLVTIMHTSTKTLSAAAIIVFLTSNAVAQVNVTAKRVSSNFYRLLEGGLVQTSGCLSLALMDDAVLSRNSIYFVQDRERCSVKAIYHPATLKGGTYKAIVVNEGDDFYQVSPDTYVQTYACLSLALGRPGTLKINASGQGGWLYVDGAKCMVEGVYSR